MTYQLGMECQHREFEAHVEVNRLEDIKQFAADVHITCLECGRPFTFIGLPGGVQLGKPTMSIDATEARLPIAPMEDWIYDLYTRH